MENAPRSHDQLQGFDILERPECFMEDDEPDLPTEIAEFIAKFCEGSRVSADRDLSATKRDLLAQIAKRWPGTSFIVVNRALSIAYEILIARTPHKQALAVIDAFRRGTLRVDAGRLR